MGTAENDVLGMLPVAVYRTDAEGRLTFFNTAAAELWGFEPQLGAHNWHEKLKAFSTDGAQLAPQDTPIGRAIRTGKPVRGTEVILERPDGERIPTMPYSLPQLDAEGKVAGVVVLVVDLREQQRARADTARLAAIVSSSDDAIISKTLDGVITSWNAGAERIFGYSTDETIGRSIMLLVPDELRDEEKEIILRLSRGERIDHFETVRVAKDGARIDLSLTVSPLYDESGRVAGASNVARDISDRKRAEEIRRLLHDELNHRIKNTLATVQAIAGQTLRRATTPQQFVTSFNGRIQALARAHGLLTVGSFQGAQLMDLVRDQLLLGGAEDQRITCSGPDLTLGAQAAVHMALVLHELGTNARKHGALSGIAGHVDVSWALRTNGGRTLVLVWQESGGPPVAAPTSRGFGSMLIEHSLRAHGGVVQMTYAESGMRCEIRLPLPQVERAPLGSLGALTPRVAIGKQEAGALAGKRVLIVEDEALISLVLVDYLTDAGCDVIGPAQTLERAKALIASERIDAALVDGNLSGHSVEDVALGLTHRNVPFVFVTGYGREALPAGFRDALIVEKPFTQEQVVGALERLFHPGNNIVALKPKKDTG